MTDALDQSPTNEPACVVDGCARSPAFWIWPPATTTWEPVCSVHLRIAHPSLERKVWLESGYARPIERGQPTEPPTDPATARAAAFRELLEATISDRPVGWVATNE